MFRSKHRQSRISELEREVEQLRAALTDEVVQREHERVLAIYQAERFFARVGMVLPGDMEAIRGGTPAHEFLEQAKPRLCGLLQNGPQTVH